jgi:hypothetical protein
MRGCDDKENFNDWSISTKTIVESIHDVRNIDRPFLSSRFSRGINDSGPQSRSIWSRALINERTCSTDEADFAMRVKLRRANEKPGWSREPKNNPTSDEYARWSFHAKLGGWITN